MVTVMVCDDSPTVRAAVRRCLTAIPEVSRVSTAASGEELLARHPVEHPDIVFLDVQMPGMGGPEALRRLIEADRRVSVVMLTSGEAPALVAEAVSPGSLRLRFSLGQGTAALSVAPYTNPLDPRYRDDSIFRLASNNLLKPWTTTS